ncbi:MAG: hypothetical protein KC544_06280 [Gemmatimonadetes bacterium]|nr:hypothetical protein [Gemmatimonadota bacterium]MCB9505016.1 hypothetical protein [Gemmatimonadales bacterium]MCA9762725.1 hypothetical protein [Gemmatimonadota bacterium]MCA9768532.1 hypothetical protein [Gemmatimonadota bacterium]HPF62281.1 hypothetical protein [Gemmatimonadales bacterium]
MIRNVTGFAVFAFLAMIAFKILGGIFGALIGLILTLLWWALVGFVIYTIIKIFSPGTAQKIRETIRGEGSPAS